MIQQCLYSICISLISIYVSLVYQFIYNYVYTNAIYITEMYITIYHCTLWLCARYTRGFRGSFTEPPWCREVMGGLSSDHTPRIIFQFMLIGKIEIYLQKTFSIHKRAHFFATIYRNTPIHLVHCNIKKALHKIKKWGVMYTLVYITTYRGIRWIRYHDY